MRTLREITENMRKVLNILAIIGASTILYGAHWVYDFFSPKQAVPIPDVFDWSLVQSHPAPNGLVEAIVERGDPNTGARTAPIYRVRLQMKESPETWMHNAEVWSSQPRFPPRVSWEQQDILVIHQSVNSVLSYEPQAKLAPGTYKIKLEISYQEP